MVNPGVDRYTKTTNQRKTFQKTRKDDTLLKTYWKDTKTKI